MPYKLSKHYGLAFIVFTSLFFCFSNSGMGRVPSSYSLVCWNGSPIEGQIMAVEVWCGPSKDNCHCPQGFYEKKYNEWFSGKIIHHNLSSRPLRNVESGKVKRSLIPKAEGEESYDFTHTLKGTWEDVVGYIGFQYHNEIDNKDYIACLIGLPVESAGNNEYKSEGWDKKVFWIDVGDGAPMHVCAIYAPNYEEDGETYDNVYWASNFRYLPPGSQDLSQARPCDMWMYLDDNDKVEEVWLDIYDENWEITKTKELGIGDQLQGFTPLIDPSEPASFQGVSLENRFQTVKRSPLFLYEHMTPNVDFVSELSKGFDFENVDLLYILYGESTDENDITQFAYSSPKNINLKWSNAKPTKVQNWFQHEMSTLMNFFLPTK